MLDLIKGVNKSIIEINNTENDYIQKAILFVNPKFNNINETQIILKAKEYINTVNRPKNTIKNKPTKSSAKAKILKCNTSKDKNKNLVKKSFVLGIIKLISTASIGFIIALLVLK